MEKSNEGGILIAIDGIDGAGKTTQCELLKKRLIGQNYSCILLKEPAKEGVHAEEIKNISENERKLETTSDLERELHYFIENRRDNVLNRINPGLVNNDFVIMDRYYFSTIAYQSIFGLDPEYIKNINEAFAPIPKITFIIDVPVDVGIARINGRGLKISSFEKQEYLEKVRVNFLKMKKYPKVYVLDGTEDIQKVHNKIIGYLHSVCKKKIEERIEIVVC